MTEAHRREHATAAAGGGDELLAPRFVVLDTLRAVGALAVLTTHVAFYSGDYVRHGVLGTLLARLDVGVALFFVLSGFLLSRPYLARAALGRPHPPTGHYLWKRLVRIYPVYVVAVLFAMLALEGNQALELRDWLVTLLLANTFVDPLPPAGLSQMWSLGVEVTFYLLLPLLMLLATGRRRLRARRVTALLVAMGALAVWWHADGAGRIESSTGGVPQQWLPAYLGWFAVGIGLALLHVQDGLGRSSRIGTLVLAAGRQPGACWVAAGALMLAAATPLAGPALLAPMTEGESLTKNVLYALVGGLVVLTGVVAEPRGRFARLFGSLPARHLGWISYGVFCLHLTLIELIAAAAGWRLFGGHGLELWVLSVLASVVAAEIAYRLVERPALRLKRIFPWRSGAALATAATKGTRQR